MASLRPTVPVPSRWRITSMEQWDQDFVDLVQPGFIAFRVDHRGDFAFGAVECTLRWTVSAKNRSRLAFRFSGFDEGDEVDGHGWVKLQTDGSLAGHIEFDGGDKSGFTAAQANAKARRTRS